MGSVPISCKWGRTSFSASSRSSSARRADSSAKRRRAPANTRNAIANITAPVAAAPNAAALPVMSTAAIAPARNKR